MGTLIVRDRADRKVLGHMNGLQDIVMTPKESMVRRMKHVVCLLDNL